jgi:CRISPR-associated protein Cas2
VALMFLVVAYDVAHVARLRRVAKCLKDYGARRQRSVFECEIPPEMRSRLLKGLLASISDDEAQVVIYELCANCRERIEHYGISSPSLEQEQILIV